MNLQLTEDQEFFRATTRRFLASEAPITEVRRLLDSERGFAPDWWRAAAELGWTSMLASEAAGGGSLSGRPLTDAVIVAEEMGRLMSPGPFLPANVVAAAISSAGSAEQRERVLAPLVSGDAVAAWAHGEPGSHWDGAAMRTTADLDGGDVVINGRKAYAEAAKAADHLLVTARTG